MKKLCLLNGIDETVIIPAYQTIIKDLTSNLKIKDVPIVYKDNFLLEKNEGATTIDKNLHNTFVNVNFTAEPIQELELYRVPVHPDTTSFYADSVANVSAKTAYRSAKLNFELIIKSKSKSTISRIIDLLYHRKLDVDTFDTHNIQISYTIPNVIRQLIFEVYTIRNKHKPMNFLDYFKNTIDNNKIDMLLSLDGNKLKDSLVITEYQTEIIGEFIGEFDKMEIDKDGIYHSLTINYQVTIQRPLSVHLEYPYFIYNEKLSDTFIDKHFNTIKSNVRNHEADLFKLLKQHDSFGISKNGYYLTYPRYDEFMIPNKLSNYTTIMSVLCIVDTNDNTMLFNIKDLPTLKFKDSAYELLIQERNNVHEYLGTIFYINLYVNNDVKNEAVRLDEFGNLRTVNPMDISKTYRVCIHLCDNISNIRGSARNRIMEYINNQIVTREEEIRVASDFGVESMKQSFRIGNDTTGIEVYKNEPLFLDIYLDMFNVTTLEVTNTIKRLTTQKPGELLFNIKIPDYNWPKLTSIHHVKIFKLFNDY